jgi:hypothetical protein
MVWDVFSLQLQVTCELLCALWFCLFLVHVVKPFCTEFIVDILVSPTSYMGTICTFCRIWDCHSGAYEELYLLVYNAI